MFIFKSTNLLTGTTGYVNFNYSYQLRRSLIPRIKKEKKVEIREKILKVSREAFLDNGYSDTSTRDIARLTGVGIGTVFNYFPTKAEILIEIIRNEALLNKDNTYSYNIKKEALEEEIFGFLDLKASALFNFPRKIIKEFFIASLTIIKDREQFIQKIIDKDLVALEELKSLIKNLQQKGLISKKIDSLKVSNLIFSSFFMDMMMYIFDGRIDKEDAFKSTKENILYLIS